MILIIRLIDRPNRLGDVERITLPLKNKYTRELFFIHTTTTKKKKHPTKQLTEIINNNTK